MRDILARKSIRVSRIERVAQTNEAAPSFAVFAKGGRNKRVLEEILVEAAGVEPASENVTGQETTCLFAFMPQALGVSTLPKTFAAAAQNGQETVAASLKS